jgi:uncharacterized protein (TIGR03437 family)
MFRWFLGLCIVGSNCLSAQPTFFRKDIPVNSPVAVVAGDFNGDHRPDLAVYSWYEGLFVLLNTGGGNFGRPIRAGVEVRSFQPDFLKVADLNGDGRDDLVTPEGLLLSRGDGTFFSGSQSNVAAIGDFNRDGKIDLLVIEPPAGPTRVLLGNGDGTFQTGAVVTPLGGFRAVVADFNRDGRSDVALDTGGAVSVFLGKGDGTFGPEVRTPLRSMLVLDTLPVADFNGDGLPDLVVEGGIALGKGDGSFQSPVPYPSLGRDIFCLAAADFTGDGKADLVVVRSGTNSVSILPGKGDGTFLPPIDQSVGWGAYPPGAAVDLDGDGRLDLVTANSGSNTLTLLLARSQGGPGLRRAVSSASDIAIVAPESLATLYASTPATASTSAAPPWPTRLGGISLEVRDSAGATRLAGLLFVSPTQINFQVPAGTALGEATLAITSGGATSVAGSMQVDALAPGLFMVSPGLLVPAATAVLVEHDGTQVPLPVFTCSPSTEGISCKLSPIPLSTAGDRPIYLSFYGTGFRGANQDNVICSITGVRVPVAYVGPQGTPGLDQINIRLLPYEALANLGYEVIISIDGLAANAAYIDLQ